MAVPFPPDALFLGLDSSTQSLKATVLDSSLEIVSSEIVRFDIDLPHYKTKDGVYRDPSNKGRIVSPTLMWIEALDLLLDKLKARNFEFWRVVAISGSAQQHGSVYWKRGSYALLSSLKPANSLLSQLSDAFSTKESPIWMDSSTTKQCRDIEEAVGGPMALSKLTGSRSYERFTGSQIRKMFESRIDVYEETERISLVSSFMGSLMIGAYASIDETDAAGMNLMDLKERIWSEIALQATAPGLEEKLGKLSPAHAVAGEISPYFVERFKFKKSCLVIQWTGDNPNSLAGLLLDSPGDLAISLGTSDTIFGITDNPEPSLEGNILPNPVDPSSYMVMLCYKNGSLTREDIRNQFASGSWDVFNEYLDNTPPLNDGRLGFYYKEQEILPPVAVGYHRFLVDVGSGSDRAVEQFDAPGEVRAIVEGQFLSMRAHAERSGLPLPPRRIVATGGASANNSILRTMAAVFGCAVYTSQRPDSASLGAALRAAHGWLCWKEGRFVAFALLGTDGSLLAPKLAVPAGGKHEPVSYSKLMKKRLDIEAQLVNKRAEGMERRELGRTGLWLSCVGFGASPLGNVFGPVSDDEALAAVRRAFDLGINFFDTSPYYGGTVSESVLGRCLRAIGLPRSEFVVSTKCGRYIDGFDFSAERVTRSIDESLARLGLDYVDLLQCHDIEFGSLDQIVAETIPAIQKLKEAGKVRFVGITGLPLGIFKYVLDRVPSGSVDVILSYCHYSINDSSLQDLLPYLESKGVGVISASPLAMGLLTENCPPDWHPAPSELKTACKAAAEHCKRKGKSISKLALQYSLRGRGISSVLVGMNSVKQVEENVAAALELGSSGIDEELLAEVESILQPVKNQTWPSGIPFQ